MHVKWLHAYVIIMLSNSRASVSVNYYYYLGDWYCIIQVFFLNCSFFWCQTWVIYTYRYIDICKQIYIYICILYEGYINFNKPRHQGLFNFVSPRLHIIIAKWILNFIQSTRKYLWLQYIFPMKMKWFK